MNTKLTLRLDEDLISSAKRYSAKSGKSLSQLVTDYFSLIDANPTTPHETPTPRVRALLGVLAGTAVDEANYRRHLERKHR
ncbi:MAG: DUF6364 family protein [Xanthomonadaceae bacterium]|nr:DUF6364 family protein [Xanthomonadaceae bacterium]MDP2184645.1 DUF6364 family protein [Xanthomonadales bacterium]MDZ4116151.1 DUF6364 family protein [Xanthomonadaceae bacterium]MDZ4378043.1 DUF6364 family protein [Xanthomonadaceae bacterium]